MVHTHTHNLKKDAYKLTLYIYLLSLGATQMHM
jgi:hypothetical protein